MEVYTANVEGSFEYSLSTSFTMNMYLSTEVAPNVKCKEHLDLKVISVLVKSLAKMYDSKAKSRESFEKKKKEKVHAYVLLWVAFFQPLWWTGRDLLLL